MMHDADPRFLWDRLPLPEKALKGLSGEMEGGLKWFQSTDISSGIFRWTFFVVLSNPHKKIYKT
jgi:hypothetical protein